MTWTVQGHVLIEVSTDLGNAVVSGIFFGGAFPVTSQVTYTGIDTTTQGDWQTSYGHDSYNVIGYRTPTPSAGTPTATPGYAAVTPAAHYTYEWANPAPSGEIAALLRADSSSRIASVWSSWTSFQLDVSFTDNNLHSIALYVYDRDIFPIPDGRVETITVYDGDSLVKIDEQTIRDFHSGKYVNWKVRGHIVIDMTVITATYGASNAVVSGVFFGNATPAPVCVPTITVASVDATGGAANNYSESPVISWGGQYIAYKSFASNLLSGTPSPPGSHIFLNNMATPGVTLVSKNSNGTPASAPNPTATPAAVQAYSDHPSISANGRYIAFESDATNLVASDTNGKTDIFVRNTADGTTTRVSVADNGSQFDNGYSTHPSISPDGRYVAFQLTTVGGYPQIYVRDLWNNHTTLVSAITGGTSTAGNNASVAPSISGADSNGHYVVVFASAATDLLGNSPTLNGYYHIFWRDLQNINTAHIIYGNGNVQGNESSNSPSISGDGRWIAFESLATNLTSTTLNANDRRVDVYAYDLQNPSDPPVLVSVDSSGNTVNNSSFAPVIAGPDVNGNYLVVFWSNASNLVGSDGNGMADVFIRNITTGQTKLVSGTNSAGNSYSPAISVDGACTTFYSEHNLFSGDLNPDPDVFSVRVSTPQPTSTATATRTPTP